MIIQDNYGHGGDVYKNRVTLDFSANVNPLGTPEAVQKAIAASASEVCAYPDPYCGRLRKKLAAHIGTEPENILCGNGAAELIFQFVNTLKPKQALLPIPSFSEYESALRTADCRISYWTLRREQGFLVTEDILDAITPEIDLLMLCTPNNPTGICVPQALLERILQRCRETGTWLFLDECFLELTVVGDGRTILPLLKPEDRVILLRAFTKLYGMAGVRLGYAICRHEALRNAMCTQVQPWNVSTPAQRAGEAALDCSDFVSATLQLIREERAFVLNALQEMGFSVLPGAANYLMISGEPELCHYLLNRGILIRSCANYPGLEQGDCRIAIRTRSENEALCAALREYCHERNRN